MCGLTTFISMAVVTDIAAVLYWHAWKTFECATPSQSLVLPFSLVVSTAVGSFLGAHLGMSRITKSLAVITGLFAFYYVGSACWISWFVPDSLLGLLEGWPLFSLSLESVLGMLFADHTTASVVQWLLICLWTLVGLAVGLALPTSQRIQAKKAVAGVLAILVAAVVLFTSVFYPLAYAERKWDEYASERYLDLVHAYSKLRKQTVDTPSQHNKR